MKKRILKIMLLFSMFTVLIGCGNDKNIGNKEEKDKTAKSDMQHEAEPLYVPYERLAEWDEQSDYFRLQIDDVLYSEGSTFGEIWEKVMSSKEEYDFYCWILDEDGVHWIQDEEARAKEFEYTYDPFDTQDKKILAYKDNYLWFTIDVRENEDESIPITETQAVINYAFNVDINTSLCRDASRFINGMTMEELKEHLIEETAEWDSTLLKDIEIKDQGNVSELVDEKHDITMDLATDNHKHIVSVCFYLD